MAINDDAVSIWDAGKPIETNLRRETEGWDPAMTDEEVDEFLGTEIVW